MKTCKILNGQRLSWIKIKIEKLVTKLTNNPFFFLLFLNFKKIPKRIRGELVQIFKVQTYVTDFKFYFVLNLLFYNIIE